MDRNDIELGTTVKNVGRRPRSGVVLSVRLSAEEADRIEDVADAQRVTVSQAVRQAVASYCEAYEMHHPAVPAPTMSMTGGISTTLRFKEFASIVSTFGSLVRVRPRNQAGCTTV